MINHRKTISMKNGRIISYSSIEIQKSLLWKSKIRHNYQYSHNSSQIHLEGELDNGKIMLQLLNEVIQPAFVNLRHRYTVTRICNKCSCYHHSTTEYVWNWEQTYPIVSQEFWTKVQHFWMQMSITILLHSNLVCLIITVE